MVVASSLASSSLRSVFAFLFSLYQQPHEVRKSDESEAFLFLTRIDFLSAQKETTRRKSLGLDARAHVKNKSYNEHCFFILNFLLSLSLSPSLHSLLSPLLSLSLISFEDELSFRLRFSSSFLSDVAINIQNTPFFFLNPCLRRWIQLSTTRNRAPNQ